MIYLGIDPGYHRCGYGVVKKEGNKISVVDYGCIETSAQVDFPARLRMIADELRTLINKHQPASVGIEELFFAKNTKTALKVAQARGVLLLCAQELAIPLIELTPNQVKQAVTGQGSADKKQMQQMVKMLLNLKEIPKPDDAADALAIALAASTWTTFHA